LLITRDARSAVRVARAGTDLVLLSSTAQAGAEAHEDRLAEAYLALDQALRERGAAPIQERVFTETKAAALVLRARARALAACGERWAVPPTVVEGAPAVGAGLAGIHVIGARGRARVVREGEQVRGRLVDGPSVRLLGLADVGRRLGERPARPPAEEALGVLEAAEELLAGEGFSFGDVARTWFYLSEILDWYGEFNGARNAFFRARGVASANGAGPIPASTGIGGRNARGGRCTLDLVAIQAAGSAPLARQRLRNPRQSEATRYGSAFARALELTAGDARYVFVSGTAAIDGRGASVHPGDFEGQVLHTLDAVAALLEAAGARIADIGQATAFLKRASDATRFEQLLGRCGIESVPLVTTIADVCRPELLFELDATAVVPVTGPECG
jgi:enamine deaminase RidA (YjgF/YER057c/UK114 family)